ncbi:1700016m24rik protein [Lynx pardinus]|uniref:1700016m24rik protein n=1 Tax=Lynx pardinus TaxID=191816 RepID=A0A485P7H7_LYNPA|nr:1700016m24rik protein [Lynx pardinus]
MSALQKSQALEAVHCHMREHTQLIRKEVPNAGLQELLAALNLELKQPLEKCACVDLVRRHLASLLELSHQSWPARGHCRGHRHCVLQAHAGGVGHAGARGPHQVPEDCLHVPRQPGQHPQDQLPFGHHHAFEGSQAEQHPELQILSDPPRPVHPSEGAQLPDHPLPGEDHIGHCGTERPAARAQTHGQVPDPADLPAEPVHAPTHGDTQEQSTSVGRGPGRHGAVPGVDAGTGPAVDELCFILQHTEPWLKSDSSHERQRAVQTIFLFLKYVADYVGLTEEATPSMLGHQIGLLMLLWRDKEPVTQSHAHQCVYLLLQLLTQQKGELGAPHLRGLNKMKNFEANARRESEMKFYDLVKGSRSGQATGRRLTRPSGCLTGEADPGPSRGRRRELGVALTPPPGLPVPAQVAEILQGLFQELPSIIFKNTLQTVMQAVSVLGTQHTQETVEVILSLCHPSERQVIPLWKALASNTQLARKVLTLLYMKLRLRPPKELVRFTQQAELISLLALGTIYELLYTREYKAMVRWAFAGVLVGLLTQLRYLFELDVVDGISDYQEDVLDGKPLSPCRTCLEALKGLFWTTNYWEVFAYLKLLRGWELFEHMETYTEGVTLLARAMAHYDCEVKAVLGQAVISLKSSEERDNVVAILIITEFLNSHELTQYMSRRTVDNFLSLGLNNPNQLVRAMSLKGLSSALMHPEKVMLLRNRLAGLLDGFAGPEPKDLMGLMEILGDILHRLGAQGVGATSLRMAQHLLQLFDDEQADVRGGAILLYGDVLYSGGKKYQQALKNHAFQALVPLLFHLADSCPKVVMKTKLTFLRCAVLLKWEFRKELFGKLAWGRGLSAEKDVFIYTVESNLDNYHRFLMQALTYLSSPDRNLKQAAMKFIGGVLQDYFPDLCICLRKADVRTLRKHLEILKQDPDSVSRRFYSSFLEDIWELSQYVTH